MSRVSRSSGGAATCAGSGRLPPVVGAPPLGIAPPRPSHSTAPPCPLDPVERYSVASSTELRLGASCAGQTPLETDVAKIHYEADGAVSAERFIAALTDFSERRPELWPNLDAKYYELHELGD